MMFMLLSIALAVTVVALLLPPLLSKKTKSAYVERDAVNVEVVTSHLNDLKQELESGEINDEQYKQYRLELEKIAADDLRTTEPIKEQSQSGNTILAIIVALVVPLLSLLVYQQLGHDLALSGEQNAQLESSENTTAELEEFIKSVEEDVAKKPNDIESRIALGQVYAELKRYADAVTLYQQLYELRPDNPAILVDYAEVLALLHDNRLTGKPAQLLDQALSIEPNNSRALWLAGFAALQSGENEKTLTYWRRLQTSLEPDSDVYQQVEKLLTQIGISSTSAESSVTPKSETAVESIIVNVSIAAELQNNVDPNTTMFVFARASEGPPMPLAVYKGTAGEIPLSVKLDDSMAMMANMSLSRFPEIIVGVRLSSNGQPQGQAGDYEGFSGKIVLSNTDVVDVIVNALKP
jgi:cytochrome c-type biogenesis protein CcmH